MIIAAEIDHRRGAYLWRGGALGAMGKHLTAPFQPVAYGVFLKKSAVRKIAIAGLWTDGIPAAAVKQPFADILLQPDGNLEPSFAYAQAFVRVACGQFEHGERADLRDVLALFVKRDFGAEFGVRQAEFGGAASAWKIGRVVRGSDHARRQDRVNLNSGNRAPVELEGGSSHVPFDRGSARGGKNVKLVMMQIHRHRVVDLKWWTLCAQARDGQREEEESGQCQAFGAHCHRISWRLPRDSKPKLAIRDSRVKRCRQLICT